MTQKTFLGAVQVSLDMINDVMFLCESRTKPTYFTRQGENNKLPFVHLVWFCLSFVRKTLQLELHDFFHQLRPGETSISKQGFSQARQKLSPTAFIKLNDEVMTWFYADGIPNTFHGYRLLAIDGTVLQLNNVPALREAFGAAGNDKRTYPRAYAAVLYDLENKLTLASVITRYSTPERTVAIDLLEKLNQFAPQKELILFDRGYPSRGMFRYLTTHDHHFLMRCPRQAMQEINQSIQPDQWIELTDEEGSMSLRVLRFWLDSGQEEILVTNLLETEFDRAFFQELYFKRWGIEGYYRELKSTLQLENVTGATSIAVKQDFYAAVYLTNMAALIKHEANEWIQQEHQGKQLTYTYQVNANLLIGCLKSYLLRILLASTPGEQEAIFQQMITEVIRQKIPIRPGRKCGRPLKKWVNKHPYNRKRCL
ncbi:IS4 family transposase [Alkalicoccus luteus]|uniref:IS4 family transposase n=1 Tax=Alkalicoccus luteus TaxID=1237094 RepID=A0A969PMT0_9BACI|nr:IS4 family transposase [Alkalicoccus luteus]NJP36163.1 IS4 family transposase [Alkalicoccus luteus]